MARSFDQIYAFAPKAAVGRLMAFRERYPYKFHERGGMMYRTWDVNPNGCAHTIVFLPSGLGHGEIWFPYMLEMSRYARCIAFSFAEEQDPDTLADTWLDLLTEMGVKRFAIVGHSIGGLMAQVMARKAPERIEALSFAMTGCPADALGLLTRQRWIKRKKMVRRLKLESFNSVQRLNLANEMFNSICPEEYQESQTFWLAFIEETFGEYVYKAQHMAINAYLVPGIYTKYRLKASDFPSALPVQIMQSQGDQTFSPEERGALRKVFPAARVDEIGDSGQFSLQLHEGKCLELFNSFFNSIWSIKEDKK